MIGKNKRSLQLSIDKELFAFLEFASKESGSTKSEIVEGLLARLLFECQAQHQKQEQEKPKGES